MKNKIHFCWFGKKVLPKKYRRFIKSWKEKHPKWEIIEWNEKKLPDSKYLKRALKNNKTANASNWARLWVLQKYGGLYLDTDIEMIRPLDDLMECPAFVGFEVKDFGWDGCVNNAVLRSERDHWFVGELRNQMERDFDGSEEAHLSSPHLTTTVLKKHGLSSYGRTNVKGVEVFPIEYFYPFGWHEPFRIKCISAQTKTIHWYGKSWCNEGKQSKIKHEFIDCLNKAAWKIFKPWIVLAHG
jgi:mannosyltransferase OCH1-like enzyme